jgi:hypothetical protein
MKTEHATGTAKGSGKLNLGTRIKSVILGTAKGSEKSIPTGQEDGCDEEDRPMKG